MSEALWIALLVGVGSPLLTIWLADRIKSRERAEDRAERVAAAAALAQMGVKIDGMLVERDKAKVLEGKVAAEIVGRKTAETLAEGQRIGAANERASVAAANAPANGTPAAPLAVATDSEVPTKDKRVAEATERSAVAQERVADAAETKKGPTS